MAEQHSCMPQGISPFSLSTPHMAVALHCERQPSPQKSFPKPQILSLLQQLPSTHGASSHRNAARLPKEWCICLAAMKDEADNSEESSDSPAAASLRGSGGALAGFWCAGPGP
jgi:hypothetical protein